MSQGKYTTRKGVEVRLQSCLSIGESEDGEQVCLPPDQGRRGCEKGRVCGRFMGCRFDPRVMEGEGDVKKLAYLYHCHLPNNTEIKESRKACLNTCEEGGVCLSVDEDFECVRSPEIGHDEHECAVSLCPKGAKCSLSGNVAQCVKGEEEDEEDSIEVQKRGEKPNMPKGAKKDDSIGRSGKSSSSDKLSDDKLQDIIKSVNAEIGRKGSHWNVEEVESERIRRSRRKDKLQRLYEIMRKLRGEQEGEGSPERVMGEVPELEDFPSAERVQEENKRSKITEFNDFEDLRVIADPVLKGVHNGEGKDTMKSELRESDEKKLEQRKNASNSSGPMFKSDARPNAERVEDLSAEEMRSEDWESVEKAQEQFPDNVQAANGSGRMETALGTLGTLSHNNVLTCFACK